METVPGVPILASLSVITDVPVPEPTALSLFGLGAVGLLGLRVVRRRRLTAIK